MKLTKSKLRRIIQEEIDQLDEANTYNPRKYKYDLQNMGGGWNGDIYVKEGMYGNTDGISVQIGLYSGGQQKYFKFKMPDDLENISYDDRIITMKEDIGKNLQTELQKFDKIIANIIEYAAKKHLK